MKLLGQGVQKLEHYRQIDRQTDRHTDRCDCKHYHVAFAGGKNVERFL